MNQCHQNNQQQYSNQQQQYTNQQQQQYTNQQQGGMGNPNPNMNQDMYNQVNYQQQSQQNVGGESTIPRTKIVLIGDGGTGKTTFITQYLKGYFEKKYVATVGAVVHELDLVAKEQVLHFEIWDTAGQELYGMMKEGYYLNAKAAILFFDLTSRISLANVNKWYRLLGTVVETSKIPIIIVGNKADLVRNIKIRECEISQRFKFPHVYFDMSLKTNRNYEKPFLHLLRCFTGDMSIQYIPNFNYKPAELKIDERIIDAAVKGDFMENEANANTNENNLKNLQSAARMASLPEEDEDQTEEGHDYNSNTRKN